jgi:1-acyl-sn-glycerol-3-phosphate acyltransferase
MRGLYNLATGVMDRLVPPADIHDRDPDYIRENLGLLWILSTFWFRSDVEGLENIPGEGPVLLVGNHSGGNLAPDTFAFSLAFITYFGVERRFFQLAHNLVMAWPVIGSLLRASGTIPASHENARAALRSGAAVLVYPGGDWEVHRPSWQSARIDFGGRKGFVRLAIEQKVPIVPVVSIGGQETALFLSRGEWLARLLRLDQVLRLKVLPISFAPPWGLNVGDFFGRLPLPAKLDIEVLPAIDIEREFGSRPRADEVYDHVVGVMQERLDDMASRRRLPLVG